MIYYFPEAPERGNYELPFDTEGFIAWLRIKDLSEETIDRYVRALNAMIEENIMTQSYAEQICDYFNSDDDSISLNEIISFFDKHLELQLSYAKHDDDLGSNRITKYEIKKSQGYTSAWHHYREFLSNRDKHIISDYGWQLLESIMTNQGIIDINIADVEDFTKDFRELYHYSYWGYLEDASSLTSQIKDKLCLKNRNSRVLLCITADKPNTKIVEGIVDAVSCKTDGTMTWGVYNCASEGCNIIKIEVFEAN